MITPCEPAGSDPAKRALGAAPSQRTAVLGPVPGPARPAVPRALGAAPVGPGRSSSDGAIVPYALRQYKPALQPGCPPCWRPSRLPLYLLVYNPPSLACSTAVMLIDDASTPVELSASAPTPAPAIATSIILVNPDWWEVRLHPIVENSRFEAQLIP